MPKPTLQEYQEAVQSPSICFNDGELKKGNTVTTPLGLPKIISGGYAGVIPIRCKNKIVAVRCFLKDVPDIEERYRVIGDYLEKQSLPYTVGFRYIEKGILVKGKWYPIVKMDWVEGDTLGAYLDKIHNDSEKLQELIDSFRKMIGDLKECQISHCDLHNRNILVVNGRLILIDYDAMYVPGLSGKSSNEVGHENFQHPERSIIDFGPFVDNFSEWIIYLSLLIVQKKPEIWELTGAGDNSLIFRKGDFTDFYSSTVIAATSEIKDEKIQKYINFLQDASSSADLENIPSIVDSESVLRKYSADSQFAVLTGASISKRMIDNIEVVDSSWIWESKPIDNISFNGALKNEKYGVYSTVLLTIGSFTVYILVNISEILLLLSIFTELSLFSSYLLNNYRKNPVISAKSKLVEEKKAQDLVIKGLEEEIASVKKDNENIYNDVSNKINKINEKIKSLKNREQERIKEAEKNNRNKLNDVIRKKRNLQIDENNETKSRLRKIQDEFIQERLKRHRIRNASISNVGTSRSRDLERNGISTAADFTQVRINYYNNPNGELYFVLKNNRSVRISGIGPVTGQNIDNWREGLKQRYTRMMPKSLSNSELNDIKNKYRRIKLDLDKQESDLKQQIKTTGETIRNQTKIEEKKLKTEIVTQSNYYNNLSTKLEEKIGTINEKMQKEKWERNRIEHELKRYHNISFKNYLIRVFYSSFKQVLK
ncbi:MAG: hypothetical protein ACTSQY_06915 [Candidatus Odinarchaeia archaeon]